MEKLLLWVFGLIVLLNEIVLKFSGDVGIFMYLILMTATLLILARNEKLDETSVLIIALLVVPLIRISELFLDVSFVWKVFVGNAILLFVGYYYSVRFGIDLGENLKGLLVLPFIVAIGALLGILGGFGAEKSLGLLMVLPLVAFSEEIFFRGLMQNLIGKRCGVIYALVFPAVIYGVMSIGLGYWLAGLFFIMSFLSGVVYWATKNVFLSMVLNLVFSIFVFVIPSII